MKKVLFITLIVCILSACGQQGKNGNNTSLLEQEGIIAEIKETQDSRNQILIISNTHEEDISNKSTNELIRMAQENDGAYYDLEPGKNEELEVGTDVIVYWNGNQNDSDPPQREAEKIDIVSK